MMVVTFANADFSVFADLSPLDFLPVIVISAVIFLIKTGVLTAIVISLKNLWDCWMKK